jgi:hypothetical protein
MSCLTGPCAVGRMERTSKLYDFVRWTTLKSFLGKDFLRRNKVVPVPWLDKMVIVSERKTWIVHTTARKPKCGVQIVSTLSMKRSNETI